ncbi:GNAT family N-acetyltransferase [Fulvimonas sp. R45]|uniref:GNAT family N-acetyltransferase n=1 Tax=Fulvimonas sp. R45 TaxID=3045937 RepID=UPI0031F31F12
MDRREICRQVARLHISCIGQGFLPQLGERFLALMYEAIDECDDSVLIVSMEGKRVVGFVSGAIGMKPVYTRMICKFPRLAWALAPSIFKPTRIRRILEIIRYGSKENDSSLPHAELLSIAVDALFRGQQRADGLYSRLCEYFASDGQDSFKIIVGKALQPAHRFYTRMGATPAGETRVHAGDDASIIYVQQLAR